MLNLLALTVRYDIYYFIVGLFFFSWRNILWSNSQASLSQERFANKAISSNSKKVFKKKKRRWKKSNASFMVGAEGFEPPTLCL